MSSARLELSLVHLCTLMRTTLVSIATSNVTLAVMVRFPGTALPAETSFAMVLVSQVAILWNILMRIESANRVTLSVRVPVRDR